MSAQLDAEFWSARMRSLAKLARADGIGVVIEVRSEGFVTYASENLPADPGWNTPVAGPLIRGSLGSRRPVGARVDIPLADGRTASSLLVAPIIWNEQLVGGLAALRADEPFAEPDTAAIARLADLVGVELAEATAVRRLQAVRTDLETRLRAHAEIAEVVRSTGDPDQLLERATRQLASVFDADAVSIMLADAEGGLRVRASLGLTDTARSARKNVGEGIAGFVAQTGQPLLLTGQVNDQRFTGNDANISDAIVVPLRTQDRTIGVVNVRHTAPPRTRFTQLSVDSLQEMAGEIAASFVAADAVRRAEEDRKQALLLYDLSRLATMANDPQDDLETAAAMLGDVLGSEIVGIWALEPTDLRFRAGRGYGEAIPPIPLADIGPAMSIAVRQQDLATARFAPDDRRRPGWAPADGTAFVLSPIGSHDNCLGVLVIGRRNAGFSDAEIHFATVLSEYLSGPMQNGGAGAHEDVAADERRRIAQEIHDGIAQELTGVVLALEACQRAFDRDPAALSVSLAKAAREARATLADVRQYMAALRANDGGQITLPSTIARLVDDVRRQTGLRVEIEEIGIERELEAPLERVVMRIVGESLRNVALHAHAGAAKLRLDYGESALAIAVEDDGVGFDSEMTSATAAERGHFGLAGMRERAESIGGTLTVLSQPGRGSVITATLPYRYAEEALHARHEPTPVLEDVEPPVERNGLLSKLFGR